MRAELRRIAPELRATCADGDSIRLASVFAISGGTDADGASAPCRGANLPLPPPPPRLSLPLPPFFAPPPASTAAAAAATVPAAPFAVGASGRSDPSGVRGVGPAECEGADAADGGVDSAQRDTRTCRQERRR